MLESVATTVKANVPPAVGVPLSVPDDERVNPAGSGPLPIASENEYGDVPPEADIVRLYAAPTVPACSVDGDTVIVGGPIVSV